MKYMAPFPANVSHSLFGFISNPDCYNFMGERGERENEDETGTLIAYKKYV